MVDLYTKTVLTVIAGALVTIALNGQVIRTASADRNSCGNSSSSPCYISGAYGGLEVTIKK